jgi:hypothetical protein
VPEPLKPSRFGAWERTAEAKCHCRRDRDVIVGVGEGEDNPKGYGADRTSETSRN